MQIITDFDSPFTEPCGLAAALGFFDGLHVGHMKIITKSRVAGLKRAVITFQNSPKSFLHLGGSFFRICTEREKETLLRQEGIDYLISLPFDERMMAITKEEFFEQILLHFNVKKVIAGFNFTFGRYAAGDANELERLAKVYGLEAEIVPEVKINGETVSSTAIRNAIRAGDYEKAEKMLGRNLEI